MGLRIALFEDHPMMRDLLVNAVQVCLGDDAKVVSVADDTWQSGGPWDLAVMDLDLGTNTTAAQLVAALGDRGVGTVVVSAAGTPTDIQECLAAGALSFVAKGSGLAGLDRALSEGLAGRPYLTLELAGKLVHPSVNGVHLTPEQTRALSLRATGMRWDSIANALGRTTADVEHLLESALTAYRTPA